MFAFVYVFVFFKNIKTGSTRNVKQLVPEATNRGVVLLEKVFLEILQNLQEKTCPREHLFNRTPLGDCFCSSQKKMIFLCLSF